VSPVHSHPFSISSSPLSVSNPPSSPSFLPPSRPRLPSLLHAFLFAFTCTSLGWYARERWDEFQITRKSRRIDPREMMRNEEMERVWEWERSRDAGVNDERAEERVELVKETARQHTKSRP
ncbi:hypothetical protein JCM8547_000938, partial [Rhodosporidiobolus lusitaniae]